MSFQRQPGGLETEVLTYVTGILVGEGEEHFSNGKAGAYLPVLQVILIGQPLEVTVTGGSNVSLRPLVGEGTERPLSGEFARNVHLFNCATLIREPHEAPPIIRADYNVYKSQANVGRGFRVSLFRPGSGFYTNLSTIGHVPAFNVDAYVRRFLARPFGDGLTDAEGQEVANASLFIVKSLEETLYTQLIPKRS
ncbi:MAG: hypothetical protein ABIA93_06550 [Candidatus Woesearchaeota archaeon]